MENNLKYIVYETTNIVNNKIYIGVHKTVDPYGWDHYLGCGVISTQPCTYQHAKTAFQFAVKKYGPKNFKRKTLAVFDTIEEAFLLEKELVDVNFIARDDVYNMVVGGDGESFLNNQKRVFRYDLSGNFINEYPSIANASITVGKDQTTISRAIYNKSKSCNSFWSLDKMDKLDLSLYNLGDSGKIKIHKYSRTGEYLDTYDSIKAACDDMHVDRSKLKDACEFGLCINNFYYCYTQDVKFDKARKTYLMTRKVYKYCEITGQYLAEYNSQKDALKSNPKSNIDKSIRLKQGDGVGYKWLLYKADKYQITKGGPKKKKVQKIDLTGKVIQIFDSATAAVKSDGTAVWGVLHGYTQTYKKHKYIYLS